MHCWKAWGDQISLWASIHPRRRENNASMSSWECPLVRNVNSPPASFPKHIHIASIRRTVLFLTSFTQVSAWTLRNTLVKSNCFDKFVNPREINSHVLELLVLQTCGVKAVVTENPWMISVVDASRGLENDENSFEDMFLDRGQLCFWASIESKIQQILHSPPGFVANSREIALCDQYSCRSRYCRLRCFLNSRCCARQAAGQWPSFLIISRCLKHWEHFEWCEKNRIRSLSWKSVCHT